MSEDAEPTANISGGSDGGGVETTFEGEEADTRAEAVVNRLGDIYWQKTYGGQDAFECLIRTILSQNTSDTASQPAHDALMDRYATAGDHSDTDHGNDDLAVALANAEQSTLAETIQSAGLYNQKSKTMIAIAERVVEEYGDVEASDGNASGSEAKARPTAEFDAFVTEEPPGEVRETLLDFSGVGPKTADCVLLFSGGRAGVFPVDTHVHRIYRRLGIAPAAADHEAVREVLEAEVPGKKCGFGHTASIQFGREYCTAREPACVDDPDACPMVDLCEQVGVDVEPTDARE